MYCDSQKVMAPMKFATAKQVVQDLLVRLDIQINSNRPWDIQVDNPDFFTRVLGGGSLALGESYMDGWWHCEALDQLFDRILNFIRYSKSKAHQCPKQVKGLYHREAALRYRQPPFFHYAG